MVEPLQRRLSLGLIVFVVLTALNVAEYVLSVTMSSGTVPYLGLLALIDAALIAYYFMHVAQIWGGSEHSDER